MKEYSDCSICERPFWVKDLKQATFISPEDKSIRMPTMICRECKRKLDGKHDPYAVNMADGPIL